MLFHIVEKWLIFSDLGHLFPSFIEHGYDDLETIKKIDEQDLTFLTEDESDREALKNAVDELKIKGGTWVYFSEDENDPDKISSVSSGIGSLISGQESYWEGNKPTNCSSSSNFKLEVNSRTLESISHQNILENEVRMPEFGLRKLYLSELPCHKTFYV